MALTNDEISKLKGACGYNVVGIGAEAYSGVVGYVAIFDRAIQPYLTDTSTTSSTVVVAAPGGATVAVTLAVNPSVPGNNVQPLLFAVGSNIVVDIGPNQETSQIQFLAGLVATVQLSNAHGSVSPYVVQPKAGEYQVRAYLLRLDAIDGQLTAYAPLTAGVQEVVGDVKLYQDERAGRRGTTLDKHGSLIKQRLTARRDLCGLLGIPYLPDVRKGGGQNLEVY